MPPSGVATASRSGASWIRKVFRTRPSTSRRTPLRAVDSESRLAWRDGWLNYYKAPLADVVKDLGRYYPGRILLLNEDMGAKRVSGSFPSKDPQAVLNALQAVLGFEQHSLLGRVIVVR